MKLYQLLKNQFINRKNELPPALMTFSPSENLLSDSKEQYFNVGSDALKVCKKILGNTMPNHILDFPSGYGRVLRWFKHEWPNAKITAVETDQIALDFCNAAFNADSILANAEMNFSIPQGVDLIFSGSLLTHFNESQWDKFFKMCIDALIPGGTLIFSAHGRINAYLCKIQHPMYGTHINLVELYEEYLCKGFSYRDYDENYPGFGISLSCPSWVMKKLEAIADIEIIFFQEGAWGQDIYAARKTTNGPMICK